MSYLKAENIKLKQKIEKLENELLELVGAIKIFASGMEGQEHLMNNHIADIIMAANELKIVAPYVSDEYALVLQDRARNGVKIRIVLNDRRFWPKEAVHNYDKLKMDPGIDLINNPNVRYLMVWSPDRVLISSGPLDKKLLEKTILIGTLITDKKRIQDMLEIFKQMLPSFMR